MDIAGKVIAILAVIVAALTIYNSLSTKGSSKPRDYPYRRRDHLLNSREAGVYSMLVEICGSNMIVFPKISLSHLIVILNNARNNLSHLRRLNAFNIDYLLCNPMNYSPVLAIIIKNENSDKKDQDEIYHILNLAGIKFITLQPNKRYDIHELSSLLRDSVGQIGEVAINS